MANSDIASSNADSAVKMADVTRKLTMCLFYIIVSASLIRFNKLMMDKDHFPFSLALSAIHMAMSTICCSVLYLVAPSLMPKMEETKGQRLELMKWFLPIGVCFAIMLFGSNQAYLYCSVTFLQFMKEGNVMIVFLLSCAVGLQCLNRTRAFVIMWVIAGASITISGEISFSLIGFALQATSQIAECSRMVMGEFILSGPRKLDPLTYTMFVAPTCLAVLLVANFFHWDPQTLDRFKQWWPLLMANAGLAFVLNVMVATVVKECSAVGFVLTGLMKDIVIVLFSAAFFGEVVTSTQATAFAITVTGVGFWSMMKVAPEAAPVKILEKMLGVKPVTDRKEDGNDEEKASLLGNNANADKRKN